MSDETVQPRGLPVYIRNPDVLPYIHDAAEPAAAGWTYANTATLKLLLCLEAVRDLHIQATRLLAMNEELRTKREIKPLAVPLFSLFKLAQGLFNYVTGDPVVRRQLKPEQIAGIQYIVKSLEKAGLKDRGDLGDVRSQIAAHVDNVAISNPEEVWGKVDLVQFAEWGILLLAGISQLLVLNLYGWTELGTPENTWNLMAADGTIMHLVLDGKEWEFTGVITLAMTPLVAVSKELVAARTVMRQLLGDFSEEHFEIVAPLRSSDRIA